VYRKETKSIKKIRAKQTKHKHYGEFDPGSG